jgi:Lar family restriction alleviation protein
MSKELKPCPFCGESNPVPAPRIGFPVHVLCLECGATGPNLLTAREAEESWNRRVGEPASAPGSEGGGRG